MTRRETTPERSPSEFSRRGFLQAALVGAGALAIGGVMGGCGQAASASSGKKTTVRLWDLFSGADGANMQSILAMIRAENPDIDLQSVTLNWGSDYYTKVSMAASGGRPPEAAILHVSRLAGYAPGGLLEPFDTARLAELGVHESDFPASAWQSATYNGELYALPMDVHAFVNFYNPEILDKAKLLGSDGLMVAPTSPEEYLEMGRAVAAATGSYGVSFGYLLDTAQAWRLFWGLYRQTGAAFEFVPGRRAELDVDAAIRVVTFMSNLLDDTIAIRKADYGSAMGAFAAKKSGMYLGGVWELSGLREAIADVNAAAMPTLFGTPANYADSHAFVLPRQRFGDPARRDATYRVLAALMKKSLLWAKAGHIPAYRPIVESPEYRELYPQRNYAGAAPVAVYDPPVWFSGAGSDFQAQVCDAIAGALQGLVKPDAAVKAMVERMNVMLAKPNPV